MAFFFFLEGRRLLTYLIPVSPMGQQLNQHSFSDMPPFRLNCRQREPTNSFGRVTLLSSILWIIYTNWKGLLGTLTDSEIFIKGMRAIHLIWPLSQRWVLIKLCGLKVVSFIFHWLKCGSLVWSFYIFFHFCLKSSQLFSEATLHYGNLSTAPNSNQGMLLVFSFPKFLPKDSSSFG